MPIGTLKVAFPPWQPTHETLTALACIVWASVCPWQATQVALATARSPSCFSGAAAKVKPSAFASGVRRLPLGSFARAGIVVAARVAAAASDVSARPPVAPADRCAAGWSFWHDAATRTYPAH